MKAKDRVIPIVQDNQEKRMRKEKRLLFPATYKPGDEPYPGKEDTREEWIVTVKNDEHIRTGDYSLEGFAGRIGEPYGISIETKWGGFDELAGNITKDRKRFEREYIRFCLFQWRAIMVLDTNTAASLDAMRSQVRHRSMRNTLLSWSIKYKVPVFFFATEEEMMYAVLDSLRLFIEQPCKLFAYRNKGDHYDMAKLDVKQVSDIYNELADLRTMMEHFLDQAPAQESQT